MSRTSLASLPGIAFVDLFSKEANGGCRGGVCGSSPPCSNVADKTCTDYLDKVHVVGMREVSFVGIKNLSIVLKNVLYGIDSSWIM